MPPAVVTRYSKDVMLSVRLVQMQVYILVPAREVSLREAVKVQRSGFQPVMMCNLQIASKHGKMVGGSGEGEDCWREHNC